MKQFFEGELFSADISCPQYAASDISALQKFSGSQDRRTVLTFQLLEVCHTFHDAW